MTNHRISRIVFDFLSDLEAYIAALKGDDYQTAATLAECDLFTSGSSLFGEGSGPVLANSPKAMNCSTTAVDTCPLSISAFFHAMTMFARAGEADGAEGNHS